MPDLYLGAAQGSALPIYLTVKTFGGELVPQPPQSPSLEIVYTDQTTHVSNRPVNVVMNTIEPGRYFYVWRIAKDEPLIVHQLIMRAIIDNENDQNAATDTSYIVSGLVQQPIFYLSVNILKAPQICYPETMAQSPKCRKHPHITKWQREEIDIGLDDRAIEGAFRFSEFPNQVVDRRVVGRLVYNFDIGGGVESDSPGGGSAQRPGNPATDTKYTYRTKYRYQ